MLAREKEKMDRRVKYIRIGTITSLVVYASFNSGFLIYSCMNTL
jgi:hypothetical protein